MKIKELIKIFRDMWIPVDDLKKLDKNLEATPELLKPNVEQKVFEFYESMPLWHIRGLGPSKARELWLAGARPKNIMMKKYFSMLPEASQIALLNPPMEKIPRELIPKIANEFLVFHKTYCQIVGSYRRGKSQVGDVDILYRGPDLDKFLEHIAVAHKSRWILMARGPSKIAGIFKSQSGTVEVDIWLANQNNYHAMLLYSTGSKNHNIIMRYVAKQHGLLLNQYGLFKDGKLINTTSEEDIFEKIGMKYKAPKDRN